MTTARPLCLAFLVGFAALFAVCARSWAQSGTAPTASILRRAFPMAVTGGPWLPDEGLAEYTALTGRQVYHTGGANPYEVAGYKGQCTWFAYAVWKDADPRVTGHAKTWWDAYKALGYPTHPATSPTAGSVGVYDGAGNDPYGHVVFVTSVSADGRTWEAWDCNAGFDGLVRRNVSPTYGSLPLLGFVGGDSGGGTTIAPGELADHSINGFIVNCYNYKYTWGEQRTVASFLGSPTGYVGPSNASPQGSTGVGQTFDHGIIHQRNLAGGYVADPYEVWDSGSDKFFTTYVNTGGGSGGPLGFPTSHVTVGGTSTYGTTGRVQDFQGGEIDDSSKYHCFAVYGAIATRYKGLSLATWKGLGYPTGGMAAGNKSPYGTTGNYQLLEGGVIEAVDRSGGPVAFIVDSTILTPWSAQNYSGGSMGWPVQDTFADPDVSGRRRGYFEGGYIIYAWNNSRYVCIPYVMQSGSEYYRNWRGHKWFMRDSTGDLADLHRKFDPLKVKQLVTVTDAATFNSVGWGGYWPHLVATKSGLANHTLTSMWYVDTNDKRRTVSSTAWTNWHFGWYQVVDPGDTNVTAYPLGSSLPDTPPAITPGTPPSSVLAIGSAVVQAHVTGLATVSAVVVHYTVGTNTGKVTASNVSGDLYQATLTPAAIGASGGQTISFWWGATGDGLWAEAPGIHKGSSPLSMTVEAPAPDLVLSFPAAWRAAHATHPTVDPDCDLNGDHVINHEDARLLLEWWLSNNP